MTSIRGWIDYLSNSKAISNVPDLNSQGLIGLTTPRDKAKSFVGDNSTTEPENPSTCKMQRISFVLADGAHGN